MLAAISVMVPQASARADIPLLRQIQLPVPAFRGKFAGYPHYGETARDHFAMRVAPDQSLLVFDSDASGRWLLVRIRNWWNEKPLTEVLSAPAWTETDAKRMARLYVDLHITPDGRYAIAFGGLLWMERADYVFPVFVPPEYVA